MVAGGSVLYVAVARQLALAIGPFLGSRADYNRVGRWPYVVAGLFSVVAGIFDPLGFRLMVISTIPAAFGGSSGLLWADAFLPRDPVDSPLIVGRDPLWWAVAFLMGAAYVVLIGRGVQLSAPR